jgi:hypothetical protein
MGAALGLGLVLVVVLALFKPVLGNDFRVAPHPVPLPIGWGEGDRRSGEGFIPFPPEIIYENHSIKSENEEEGNFSPTKNHTPPDLTANPFLGGENSPKRNFAL